MTILNVDDEPQARRALRIALIARGFEYDDAISGEEAIDKLRVELPDVVLLDMLLSPASAGSKPAQSDSRELGCARYYHFRQETREGTSRSLRSRCGPVHYKAPRHR